MEQKVHRYSLLVVSSGEKFHARLRQLLPPDCFEPILSVPNAAAAREAFSEQQYSLVLLNSPLSGGGSTRLALDFCENSTVGLLMLVREEHYPQAAARLTPSGVLVLAKPVSPKVLLQSLQLLAATHERLFRMQQQAEEKTACASEKLEEMRLVDRAKWLLIDELKMTEQQAHRYIEKQAMDRCVTRRAVAENILTIYHNGGIQT